MTRKPGGIFKHGDSRRGNRTKEYRAWYSIKERCHNPKSKQFRHYGENGIVVCERWLHSFENFLSDMGRAPSKDHSIDRYPDQKGDYRPENCRWATRLEQSRNRRSNVFIVYNGEKMYLMDFAKKLGVTHSNVIHHLKKGRTVDEMVAFRTMGNGKYANNR